MRVILFLTRGSTAAGAILASAIAAQAQDVWTNTLGGKWEDPSWSLGLPQGFAPVMIMNEGSKTIAFSASTYVAYTNAPYFGHVTVSAPEGFTNKLVGLAPDHLLGRI